MNNEHISFCSDEKSLESKNNVNDHSELYFILENFKDNMKDMSPSPKMDITKIFWIWYSSR